MFGLRTWGSSKAQMVLAKKPTKFMTNSRSLGNELRRKCDGSHQHQMLLDGRAKEAARYPPALCRAICRGIAKEKMQRQMGLRVVMDVGEGFHRRRIDTEANHENDSAEVDKFIRRQLEESEMSSHTCEPEDLTGAATGPVSETMRPVVGPERPPPPGPSRRCPGNGG